MVKIEVPGNLSLRSSLEFRATLQTTPEAREYVFDFGGMKWVTPFGFLFVSAAIDDFVDRHSSCRVSATNFERHYYHAHMGFFRAFGLKFGNDPGQASGSMTYLPVTIQRTDALRQSALEGHIRVEEAVELEATRMAQILARSSKGNLVDTLAYALREIMRNVLEHSVSDVLEYCAQYWPSQDKVEIALLDRGIGVYKSLSNNPHLHIESEQHALNLSLLPGVSGKVPPRAQNRQDDVWQNSGYGLYMTSRLCKVGGDFFIGSGKASVRLKGDNKEYLPFDFAGTVVHLVLKPSQIGHVTKALNAFSREGAKIAKELCAYPISASSASRMLSRDFKAS